MAQSFRGISGRKLSLDPGEQNAVALTRVNASDSVSASFADRLPFSFSASAPVAALGAPAAAASPVATATATATATIGPITFSKGIDGHAASNEIQVFGCFCGCASKEGMVHDSMGLTANVQAPVTIADEDTLTVDANGTVSGVIDATGDVDFINVDLVAGETYLISMRGTGADPVTDTFLEIYEPGGGLVNFDDDGGNGTFSIITITALTTGTYSIEASSFSNPDSAGTGGWTVDVRTQTADAVGDTNATSVVLEQGNTFGFIETGGDVDRYAVTLEAGKLYTFEYAAGADYATDFTDVPEGEVDTILVLRDSAGNILSASDDIRFPTDISSSIGFFAETGGTYYLDAFGYSPQTGGYAIDFKEIELSTQDPLDSIDWFSSNNVPTVDVGGVPTVYVYFGDSDENFGQLGDDGETPMVTIDWNDFEKGQVMLALEEYSKVLGINYEITEDVGQAEFRLLKTESQAYGAYFFPQDPSFGADQGVGVFNVLSGGWNLPGQAALEQGGFSFSTILHEFGHAHGVAHPHDTGGGSEILLGVTSAFNSYGLFNLNQGVYTVMSYNDGWDFNPAGPSPFTLAGIANGWTGTLSPFDIAILERRYGTDTPFEAGDNVYTLTDVQADAYYQAIYDTGGTDSISYSGSGNATIDLIAATLDYSPTGGGRLSFVSVETDDDPALDGIWGGYTIANGVLIENATGGSGNDGLLGNDSANVLTGNSGDDLLSGRQGIDLLDGGEGTDTASYFDATGSVEVLLLLGTATGDGRDTLVSIENVIGSEQKDRIAGDGGANRLAGGGGADLIRGHDGDDILRGDRGADTMDGGNGFDTVTFAESARGVRVNLSNNRARGEGDDVLLDIENVTGSELDDILIGRAGRNELVGGGGNDRLNGLGGEDMLTGGLGADTFEFSENWGADFILDFNEVEGDGIDLSRISGITDLNDLLNNHLRANADNGFIEIFDGNNVIQLVGVTSLFGVTFGSGVSGAVLQEPNIVI